MATEPHTEAGRLLEGLTARGWSLGTAESLTGGLLAATFVAVAGASQVFRGSVVAYDPGVKIDVLGVPAELVERVGTVAQEVAAQMALGARRVLGVDVALATTGVAGPGPSEGHPAGTVWLACAAPTGVTTRVLALTGDRPQVRTDAVLAALVLGHEVALSADGGPMYGGA
ncbi:nicotinamide-nucleotide amidohydrolase family protein [Janibacter cremeus]|uniref:Nicotinamide-nucleotide amidase n=1 Tax=Janibacter cremeus TaxID=1285192 RepID=A0A852VTS1_9MICO|nr:nicotinamide-nucleotide amidase [Janibacter cremeus]